MAEPLLCIQYLDGISFRMKRPFDFSFLRKYGTVFQVFDDQDSGNICFGTEKDGKKFFIKFAGAPTAAYGGSPEDAIVRLEGTLPIYRKLHHRNLIEFISSEEIDGGFAMIFKWTDAKCMARMYPESRARFLQLSMNEKMQVFRDILDFFAYLAKENFVAIDFYDGSIMYDFAAGKTVICDIDFFRKMPCVNDMGRMWGSSLFQSPEEYRLGAAIDQISNVYTLGATAFALLADFDRSRNRWPLGDSLYTVAAKATSEDRAHRQQSIQEFITEWEAAL